MKKKRKKLKISELKVDSFVTNLSGKEDETVGGGDNSEAVCVSFKSWDKVCSVNLSPIGGSVKTKSIAETLSFYPNECGSNDNACQTKNTAAFPYCSDPVSMCCDTDHRLCTKHKENCNDQTLWLCTDPIHGPGCS